MQIPSREVYLAFSNELLHLIVLPTEACNFRCTYCYEDFRHKRMAPWVVQGIKALLTRRAPGLRSLSVSWFGGEPLLASDIIADVMGHANRLRADQPSMSVEAAATTNGFLLDRAMLDRLVSLGVKRYQITFDGPRALHDRKRVRIGGRGTFDRIWSNLIAARVSDNDFRIVVRVHVDRENADSMPQFIDQFAEEFRADSRFEIFIRGLARLGGANDSALQVLEPTESAVVISRLRDLARSQGLQLCQGEDPVCYAARPSSFVIRANGRLNKCTVALEHPKNQVGQLREDGTMAIDAVSVQGWIRGFKSGVATELKCPMKNHAEPWVGANPGHPSRSLPLRLGTLE